MNFKTTTNNILIDTRIPSLIIGCIGKKINTIDYSQSSEIIRHHEKKLLKNFIDVPSEKIVMLNQVHGDEIIEIEYYPQNDVPWIAEADGMITSLTGLCLVIRTADCVPVFAFDKNKKILGAVHSGWRGCQLNIVGKLIRTMKNKGCLPANISVFILPSIGPQSYSVNSDVAIFFPNDIQVTNDQYFLDLWGCIGRSALEEGIPKEAIYNAQICTFRDDRYFSHRRKDLGRNLNFGLIL